MKQPFKGLAFKGSILKRLTVVALAIGVAAPAAKALPVAGSFSGVIASESNPDFTPRYSAGDDWSLTFMFQDDVAPVFVGSDFADYSLSAFNFVSLRLNGFITRPVSNGFAMRVREDTFSIFGNLTPPSFTSPFTRSGFYDFSIHVEGPGIATDFTDLSTVSPAAINAATPFSRLKVDGESGATFGGSTRALLTLNNTSIQRIFPPPPPTVPPSTSVVPVPASGVLFASLLGLIAVWGAGRRKKVA